MVSLWKRVTPSLLEEEGYDLKYVLYLLHSPADYINREVDATIKHKLRTTRSSLVGFASSGRCLLERRYIYIYIFHSGPLYKSMLILLTITIYTFTYFQRMF